MTQPIPQQKLSLLWQDIREEALAALDRVGQSGHWILGKEVAAFEQALASYWGLSHAIGCANGTDAIEVALLAGGLKHGDKVLTTPLSAFATTLAIVRAGGVPVFVDVDASGLMDLALAEQALAADSSIEYMVPVHLYGHAIELDRLRALKEKTGVFAVEDCAQAIGASSRGVKVGTVGDFAATSFYPTKNLGALGDGGAMLTSSDADAALARQIRDYGQTMKFVHDIPGINSRLDETHAAMLSVMLRKLDGYTAHRRKMSARLLKGLKNQRLQPVPVPPGSESVWHLFPVLVQGDRAAFQKYMTDAGVVTAVHYPHPIPNQRSLEGVGIQVVGGLENTKRICGSVISLPMHAFLTDSEVERVIELCNQWQG